MNANQKAINDIVDRIKPFNRHDLLPGFASYLCDLFENEGYESAEGWLRKQYKDSERFLHYNGNLLEEPLECTKVEYVEECLGEMLSRVDGGMRATLAISGLRIGCPELVCGELSDWFAMMLEQRGTRDFSSSYYLIEDSDWGSESEREDFFKKAESTLPHRNRLSHISDELYDVLKTNGPTYGSTFDSMTEDGRIRLGIRLGKEAPCLITVSEYSDRIHSIEVDCVPMLELSGLEEPGEDLRYIDNELEMLLRHQIHPDAEFGFRYFSSEGVFHRYASAPECYSIPSLILSMVREMWMYSKTIKNTIDYYQEGME